ncbi:unnamed protein product [Arabidopsis thaliana]|uniref:Uncharacterized protein n=1 Tax=Arabidopsis thaliana TaxID=3702 RepID=A0A654EMQ4_ARATH|nr:unnamed protein product [Arabidopsis thaliana]
MANEQSSSILFLSVLYLFWSSLLHFNVKQLECISMCQFGFALLVRVVHRLQKVLAAHADAPTIPKGCDFAFC